MIPCNALSIQEIEKNFKRFVEPLFKEYDGWFPCCRKKVDLDTEEDKDKDDEERDVEE